jgi:leucyl-tRNA synthetase
VWEHVSQGPVAGEPTREGLTDAQREIRRMTHATLTKVGDDLGRRHVFNTAIAAVMELMNALGKFDDATPQGRAIRQESLELIVQMLAPITPHVSQVLWRELGHDDVLIDRRWPAADPAALVRDTIELVVQVNGKVRSHIKVDANADDEQVRTVALADPATQKWIEGKPIRMFKVVKGRLVTIAV